MPPSVDRNSSFSKCESLTTLFVLVGAKANYEIEPWNAYDIVKLTNIEGVLQENKTRLWPADVYSLDGKILKYKAFNLNGLPKGVYVVRGKKIMK